MAKVLRSMVLTLSTPDPDDLSAEEREVWVLYQLADLTDLEGVEDALREAMPGNSAATLKGLEDRDG